MPRLVPIARHLLIARLREHGFAGPFSGGQHQFMLHGLRRVIIPNPHQGSISVALLIRLLRHAGISRDAWLRIK